MVAIMLMSMLQNIDSTIYASIGGSRAHGIEIEESDVDLYRVGSPELHTMQDGYNLIQILLDDFVRRLFVQRKCGHDLQLLYPLEMKVDNDLTRCILQSRDSVIEAIRPTVYDALMDHAARLCVEPEWLYPIFPKRLTYALLFYSILSNYADGMPFAQAMRPDGILHDRLIAIRKHKPELDEVMEWISAARTGADEAKGFYQSGDLEPVRELGQTIRRLAKKETGEKKQYG